MKTSIVVGTGLGGLAAALRLRARGYEVTVVDKLDSIGGRSRVFKQDGFTFDAGPTVITAPLLLEELFQLFGKNLSDYIELVEVDPWYRFVFANGDFFDYGAGIEKTLEEIHRLSARDVQGYKNLLKASEEIFKIGFEELSDQAFLKLGDFFKQVPAMVRLRAYRNVYSFVSSHLKDERLRRAFSIQPLLVGGNPFDTSCIYNLIHYLECKWGVHYAVGGTGSIVQGLKRLMEEQGIRLQMGVEITHGIEEKGELKKLVAKDGTEFDSDLVVWNGDPAFFYRHVLRSSNVKHWTPKKIDKAQYSMGLYVYYFGTDKIYSEVAHHTILMGDSYKSLLKKIFKTGEIEGADSSLYLHRPTATDASMAPDGHDCFYVLCPVPNLGLHGDWDRRAPLFKDEIVKRLETTLLPELSKHIVSERILHPGDFERDYCSYRGTGFSIAPTLRQSAYFRFHNRSDEAQNLFFVGAGTHPGAGIPGVLSSAKVLERVLPR